MLIALGTHDAITLHDQHMGESKRFLIYEVDERGTRRLEIRENVPYEEDPSHPHGDPGKAQVIAQVLAGVDVLAARHFGPNIKRMLRKRVCVRVRVDTVDEAIALLSDNLPLLLESQRQGPNRKPVLLPRKTE